MFLEDWALRHFTTSVKLHDVGSLERRATPESGEPSSTTSSVVQGILLELHDFASA